MSGTPLNEAEVRSIVRSAEQAGAAGRRDEARRLLSQAQALAPDHPFVLNAAALEALRTGDAQAARGWLERAVARDGQNPTFWMNLAMALRALNLAQEESHALDRVLALEPRHLLALLQKASLLERQDKRRAAAATYQKALQTLPPGTRLPEALRPAIQRAVETVRDNKAALAAFLHERLAQVRTQHAEASQERFDHCIDSFLGKKKIFTPQPNFLHFPKISTWEYYPRTSFPWLPELESATSDIRGEFERVFAEDADRLEPYIAYPEGAPLDQWAELNHSRRWSAFYLWRDGAPLPEHLARCPKTAAALRRLPLADLPGYAPTAFFSILDARTQIPAHTGVTNTRLIVHLPLVIPGACRFRVGSETREWRAGEAWVFDDTIEHEAWNDSDVPRAILIFDIWHPDLSAAERDLVRAAVPGIRDYYGDEAGRDASA
jgi:aspartyl/asparaginyl beta-hydroxylase (cupin superfamily)